jgi:hypothetical protein
VLIGDVRSAAILGAMSRLVLFTAALGLGLVPGLAAPVAGQGRQLTMLDQIPDGRWELHFRDRPDQVQRLCIHDARALIQLRHPEQACDRIVVEDGANAVTVQYTCRGRGYGRTHIRRETAQLIQVESQGIAGGLPFDFAAEGRRVGDCPA